MSSDSNSNNQELNEGSIPNSIPCIMVRGIDGNISSWNPTAEKTYGWNRRQAVGNISHTLLKTVFPIPLSEINHELMTTGFWEGELIHTLSDGHRVKVLSRWELQPGDTECTFTVYEINDQVRKVCPDSAHLAPPKKKVEQLLLEFYDNKKWWLAPLIFIPLLFWIVLSRFKSAPLDIMLD